MAIFMASQESPFTPLNDRILVKPRQMAKVVDGIFIPESANANNKVNYLADVISVGKDVADVKPGMVVCVDQYGGVQLKLRGELYVEIKESHLAGIVTNPDEVLVRQPPDPDSLEQKRGNDYLPKL
jgi:co-chaperonin GroES (HSP10)